MILFIAGAFLSAVGLAGMSHQPLWPAVCLAFWQSVWFVGGFCQNPQKVEAEMEAGATGQDDRVNG